VEFGGDDFKSAVGLPRPQVVESDRPGHQVGELEAWRIRDFGDHDQLEWQGAAKGVGPVADAPECEFKLRVLPLAAFLDDDLVLVKHHFVMAPELEFEALERGADLVYVGILVNHGEKQNENRKLRVNVDEVVIAAFIDEDEVITERGGLHGSLVELEGDEVGGDFREPGIGGGITRRDGEHKILLLLVGLDLRGLGKRAPVCLEEGAAVGYKRRWTVERTIAWLQNYRRLCIRWEKSTEMFQGFIILTCALLHMKEVLGWVLESHETRCPPT